MEQGNHTHAEVGGEGEREKGGKNGFETIAHEFTLILVIQI